MLAKRAFGVRRLACAFQGGSVLPRSLVLLTLSLACRSTPSPDVPHPRIVSLLPNATEILFALGAGDHVAGATRYCTRPDAARAVPRVGGILDVSIEEVLAARPDVVIGSPTLLKGRLGSVLDDAGVAAVPLTFETPESVIDGIRELGRVAGREREAGDLAESIRRDLESLRDRARREPRIRVLFVVGRSPLVVAGPGSFLGDLLDRMGVDNVVPRTVTPFPSWSLEQVLATDPDVIVDGAVEAADLAETLEGTGLRAAAEGRVIRLRDDAILRPGPAAPRAALDLARRIPGPGPGGPE
jgi:iron complex transport system substrate-binding protein